MDLTAYNGFNCHTISRFVICVMHIYLFVQYIPGSLSKKKKKKKKEKKQEKIITLKNVKSMWFTSKFILTT